MTYPSVRSVRLAAVLGLVLLSACASTSEVEGSDDGAGGAAGPGGSGGEAGQGGAGAGGESGASGQSGAGGAGQGGAGVSGASGQSGGGGSEAGASGQGGAGGGEAGASGQGGAGQGGSGGASGEGGAGGGGVSGASGQGGAAGSGGAGQGGTSGASGQSGAGQGGSGGACGTAADKDGDGDGWTPAEGDCNDCDPFVNPGAIDLVDRNSNGDVLPPAAQVDNDCDGSATLEEKGCDEGLAVGDVADPFAPARAMGLCKVGVPDEGAGEKSKKGWGVIAAAFGGIAGPWLNSPRITQSDKNLDYGVLDAFGAATTPQEGVRVFALSSGEARAPGQPGFIPFGCSESLSIDKTSLFDTFAYPAGFPKDGTCGTTGEPYDGVGYDLKIRIPTNAKAMSFDYRFFTCEYPKYTCGPFNDVFAVLMSPSPLPANDPMGAPDGQSANVAFELAGGGVKNVIGVNNESFMTACEKGASSKGNYANCAGTGDLAGTGFEKHGASAWLSSVVPVTPGSVIHLRLAVWDSNDPYLDSTVVVDNFQFSAVPVDAPVTVIKP